MQFFSEYITKQLDKYLPTQLHIIRKTLLLFLVKDAENCFSCLNRGENIHKRRATEVVVLKMGP